MRKTKTRYKLHGGAPLTLAAAAMIGALASPLTARAASGTGLKGEYYSYRDLTHFEFSRIDSQVNFNWGTGGPSASTGSDTFGIRWSGSVEVPANDTYTFYTYSDDGVRVWVNGQRIINNYTDHSPTENKGSLYLQAGKRYDIKIEYYENTGGAQIQLRWSSSKIAKQLVPQVYLYPVSASTPVASPTPAPTATPTPKPAPSPTATPVPPSATPSPTPVPPSTGYVRPFAPDALFNIKTAGLQQDPNSADLSYQLWNFAPDRPGNFNVNTGDAYAVYYVKDATMSVPVATTWSTNVNGTKVPWNPNWKIPAGSDKKVVILDPSIGREWNFWLTSFDGSTLRATNGSIVPGSYFTSYGTNPPSRGVGIAYQAMLVRPAEIRAGVIPHALAQTINNTDGSCYVDPAVKLEHPGRGPGIPEGTRFALRITDAQIEAWVSKLPAESQKAGRVIAVALRDYGWFVTDTGGAGAFEFEDNASASAEWAALGMSNPRDMLDGLMTQDKIYAIAAPAKHCP